MRPPILTIIFRSFSLSFSADELLAELVRLDDLPHQAVSCSFLSDGAIHRRSFAEAVAIALPFCSQKLRWVF